MKIDEALEKVVKIVSISGVTDDTLPDETRGAIRIVLDELYQSGMVQGQRQLQDEIRHLLGVVKE